MSFKRINIEEELLKTKEVEQLLKDAQLLLKQDAEKEEALKKSLQQYLPAPPASSSHLILGDQDLVFSLNTIKATCVKYRLRFLDSQLFKNEIPYEALL